MRYVLAYILALCALAYSPSSLAQHEGHALHHDAYSEWMQPFPMNTVSCCNGRVDNNGELVGDCYATEFQTVVDKDGQITGYLGLLDPRTNGGKREFVPLPENKRVREKNPDPSGASGHLCENVYHAILCWVPPTGTN